jgi:hypothetical protein
MPQPKKLIEVEKIMLLADYLRQLAEVADRVAEDSRRLKKDGVFTDGWPTCARAVQFIVDQLGKIAGPLAVSGVNPHELLPDGQSFASTRKSNAAVQEKLAEAHKQVAEAKKPYKNPPKDTPPE